MSKLARKLFIGVSIILAAVILISLFINSRFLERYYLHDKKNTADEIAVRLRSDRSKEAIHTLEEEYQCVIVEVDNEQENTRLNEILKDAFLDKGMGLDNFWLWEQDQNTAVSLGSKLRIYQQKNLNYSLLVEYVSIDTKFYGIGLIIANFTDMIHLMNVGTVCIFLVALFVMITLISILVRKHITNPLQKISETADDIAHQNFHTLKLHTNDEIELLADSINETSLKIQESRVDLEAKNQQMEQLLSNVSHDLKTPIALINAYAIGMKDGMDDGTFLDTILSQNKRMQEMIQQLLLLSGIKNRTAQKETIDMSRLLESLIEEQEFYFQQHFIICLKHIEPNLSLYCDAFDVQSIFSNLISNAMKYTDDQHIKIDFIKIDDEYYFEVRNHIYDQRPDLDQIWNPFYVHENSRNSKLSGTGLGLSIVKTIAEKNNWMYGVRFEDDEIIFYIRFS